MGNEKLEDIHAHLEHIAKEELDIAKREQQANGVHRPDAAPLTEKEKRLSRLDEKASAPNVDIERVKINRARWRWRRAIRSGRAREAWHSAVARPHQARRHARPD